MSKPQPHYLIVGARSKTGRSLVNFFSKKHFTYSISDTCPNFFDNLSVPQGSLPVFVYDSPQQGINQLQDISHICIAPGVPRNIPLLVEAHDKGIPIDSETAFAIQTLKYRNIHPVFLGITGSLGKSSTAYLLYQILTTGYENKETNVFLLGNFSTPLLACVDQITSKDIVVLELSSYQLEDADKYRLHGVSILNVSPNHLDRYNSYTSYQQAKENIFTAQEKSDFAIVNLAQPQALEWEKMVHGECIKISSHFDPNTTCCLTDDSRDIYVKGRLFLKSTEISLNSPHMLENMCTAIAFALHFHIDESIIKSVVSSFQGLEHRSEHVKELHHICFINDSKATTPYAVVPNLKDPRYGKMVLILGGKNKNLDFSILRDHLEFVAYIVYYGVSGLEIQDQLKYTDSVYIQDFQQAIEKAYRVAKEISAHTVLLSPGCASFDQFTDYEHRGTTFKQIVHGLES